MNKYRAFAKNEDVAAAGAAAYKTAFDAAKAEGKSDDEADVAGKNAALAARIAKAESLLSH